ncbi:MAG TPA: hypothetical protein VG222_06295 [Vicinamibacterales bacterium]|jgi:hypothetical protein|nr:hypothetical protein [Vicinamibacterales bacterium]
MVLKRRPRTLTHALATLDAVVVRVDVLEHELASTRKELDIQFKRIAQLQAEVDDLRVAAAKIRG